MGPSNAASSPLNTGAVAVLATPAAANAETNDGDEDDDINEPSASPAGKPGDL